MRLLLGLPLSLLLSACARGAPVVLPMQRPPDPARGVKTHLTARHCAEAEAALQRLASSDPDQLSRSAQGQYMSEIGDCYRDVANYKDAARLYATAAGFIQEAEGDLSPTLERPLFSLGQMQTKLESYEQAEATFEHAMAIQKTVSSTDGDVVRLHTFPKLAEVKEALGKNIEAAVLYKEWFAAAREHLYSPERPHFTRPVKHSLRRYRDLLTRLKQDDAAKALTQDIVLIWGPLSAELVKTDEVIALGDRALARDDLARAQALYAAALEMNPQSSDEGSEIQLKLAEAQKRAGNTKAAEESEIIAFAKQAQQMERDGNYAAAVQPRQSLAALLTKRAGEREHRAGNMRRLSEDLARTGRTADANKCFEEWVALQEYPGEPSPRERSQQSVADFYYYQHDFPQAYIWFKKYLTATNADEPFASRRMVRSDAIAFIQTCMALEKLAEAEAFLKAAIGPDPERMDDCRLFQQYAGLLRKLNRTGEAQSMEAAAERCVERSPFFTPIVAD